MDQNHGARDLGKMAGIVFMFFCSMTLVAEFGLASASRQQHPMAQSKTYIVHVRQPVKGIASSKMDRESWYKSFLPESITACESESRMVYMYSNVIDGFAARLTSAEVESMTTKDGFLHAYVDQVIPLQTTRTPRFLGLSPEQGLWHDTRLGSGTIIGVLDGGIWPEHPSLNDTGMPPPPKKWKGWCVDAGQDFNSSHCNNKLIGAQVFSKGAHSAMPNNITDSPRDQDGHGTHTATTAAGSFVGGAGFQNTTWGTAAGVAPLAHLAVYKVCSPKGCYNSDVMAGFDQAIHDGVDVLSISLAGKYQNYSTNPIALGAFRAMQKGMFVSCAAGNFGPLNNSVQNLAPWILTVGASTVDRELRSDTKLGSGKVLVGQSFFLPKGTKPMLLPLVYLVKDRECNGNLSMFGVSGKLMLCDNVARGSGFPIGSIVKKAGGAGLIFVNPIEDGFVLRPEGNVLPISNVNISEGNEIKAYINSTQDPKATIIVKGIVIGEAVAPIVANFSARGPNLNSMGILKPDIIGPGLNILAGWPFATKEPEKLIFNVLSGTSMSTPHLSGIAALLKAAHPNWSPAAIKSAMMTTTNVLNNKGKPITEYTGELANVFTIGAGHVNPTKATNPGLVYDIDMDDYIPFFCGLGYSATEILTITEKQVNCSKITSISERDINYPSFSVVFSPSGPSSFSTKRTVTNVGAANSSYEVEVVEPNGVSVKVEPSMLSFMRVNQKQTYQVTFSIRGAQPSSVSQGHIKWFSGSKYQVRSPIAIFAT